jgi:filamentous hemagglutinin
LSTLLGQPAGYINNGTEGLAGDVGEYLPDSVSKKDVLNEYTYRTLDAKGPTLIVTHSAGNEDARKALLAGALYDHRYDNLSFVSVGSPVSARALQQAAGQGGAQFLGQVNDWRDPVTYSKTAGTVSLGSFLAGMGYGALQGCGAFAGGGALGCIAGGVTGAAAGAAPGIATFIGLKTYHPFEQYLAKQPVQGLLFDWSKANTVKSPGQ